MGSPPGGEPVSWCSSREARVERLQPGLGQVWVGIDIGKHAHHAAAVDGDGRLVWSRRVANDQAALQAAAAQKIRLPAQDLTAQLIAELASDLLALDRRIKELDKTIGQRLARHPQAPIICSLPGMGPLLAAELLVAVGDLRSFPDAGHLAAYGGLAPVARDSGRRTNNLHPPTRYNRSLRRVFYLSALSSLSSPGPNRDYYQRKRAQGRRHQQALMALARRRVDVLWALLRDNRCFELAAPIKATTA